MNKNQETFNTKEQKISEKQIKDYVTERFEDVKDLNKIKNLVSFQAMNKYMIMSHDQNELKILGNIVASNKKVQFSEILIEYEKHLKKSFEKKPTTKTHSNVIMHVFGYFSKDFTQLEKEQFFELLKQFQEEKITIGDILAKINPMIFRFNNTYLASQTYFLLYSDPQQDNIFEILAAK
ncbi:MAG: YbgA family protein [Nitrosopumilus sp.]|nr:YbgA family protein [Nitrosopumilus sp.]